jgi:hypothetical protein
MHVLIFLSPEIYATLAGHLTASLERFSTPAMQSIRVRPLDSSIEHRNDWLDLTAARSSVSID